MHDVTDSDNECTMSHLYRYEVVFFHPLNIVTALLLNCILSLKDKMWLRCTPLHDMWVSLHIYIYYIYTCFSFHCEYMTYIYIYIQKLQYNNLMFFKNVAKINNSLLKCSLIFQTVK